MTPSGPFDLQPITSPATGARGAEALPDDFAEEAAGRLRIVALVMAGLWSIGIAVNHLIFPYLDLRPEQIVPWTPVSDFVGLMSIVLSAGVYAVAPRVARDPGQPLLVRQLVDERHHRRPEPLLDQVLEQLAAGRAHAAVGVAQAAMDRPDVLVPQTELE